MLQDAGQNFRLKYISKIFNIKIFYITLIFSK